MQPNNPAMPPGSMEKMSESRALPTSNLLRVQLRKLVSRPVPLAVEEASPPSPIHKPTASDTRQVLLEEQVPLASFLHLSPVVFVCLPPACRCF